MGSGRFMVEVINAEKKSWTCRVSKWVPAGLAALAFVISVNAGLFYASLASIFFVMGMISLRKEC